MPPLLFANAVLVAQIWFYKSTLYAYIKHLSVATTTKGFFTAQLCARCCLQFLYRDDNDFSATDYFNSKHKSSFHTLLTLKCILVSILLNMVAYKFYTKWCCILSILLSISSSTMTGVHGLWFVGVVLFVTSTALVTVGKCV